MIDDLLRIPEYEIRPAEAMQASLCYTLAIRGRMLQSLSFVRVVGPAGRGYRCTRNGGSVWIEGYTHAYACLNFGYGTGNWDDLAVLIIVHTTTTCNVCILNDLATFWTASTLRHRDNGGFFCRQRFSRCTHRLPVCSTASLQLVRLFSSTYRSLALSLPLSCCLPLAGAPLPSPHFLYLCYFSPYTPGLSLQSDSLLSPPLSPYFFPARVLFGYCPATTSLEY